MSIFRLHDCRGDPRNRRNSHCLANLSHVKLPQHVEGGRKLQRGADAASTGHGTVHEMAEQTLTGFTPLVRTGLTRRPVPVDKRISFMSGKLSSTFYRQSSTI